MNKLTSERRSFSGVCFDLYSTLIHEDPRNPFYSEVARLLELDMELWLPAYRKRGKDSMSGRLRGMVDRVSAAATDVACPRPASEVAAAVESAFPLFIRSVELDPHTRSLLRDLRAAGCRLALVSNASSYSEVILDRLDLRDAFDSVVLSYRVRLLKPDPAIYRKAAAELGGSVDECLFVGDGGDRELAGARAAGMATLLVDRGLAHSASAAEHADTIVSDLSRVRDIALGGLLRD